MRIEGPGSRPTARFSPLTALSSRKKERSRRLETLDFRAFPAKTNQKGVLNSATDGRKPLASSNFLEKRPVTVVFHVSPRVRVPGQAFSLASGKLALVWTWAYSALGNLVLVIGPVHRPVHRQGEKREGYAVVSLRCGIFLFERRVLLMLFHMKFIYWPKEEGSEEDAP